MKKTGRKAKWYEVAAYLAPAMILAFIGEYAIGRRTTKTPTEPTPIVAPAPTILEQIQRAPEPKPERLERAVTESVFVDRSPVREQIPVQNQTNLQEKIRAYPDPKTDELDFDSDNDVMLLARAIYGEARGQIEKNPDYVYGVTRSIRTRANRKGKSIRDFILAKRPKKIRDKNGKEKQIDVFAYTCFNPGDVNYDNIRDPKDLETWRKSYDLAEQALKGGLNGREDLKDVTNYFVGGDPEVHRTKKEAKENGIPSWAYKMKAGKFILDENRKRIPREPKAVVEMGKRDAYFYDFGKYF